MHAASHGHHQLLPCSSLSGTSEFFPLSLLFSAYKGSLMAQLIGAHVNPICSSYNHHRSPLLRSTTVQRPLLSFKHPQTGVLALKSLSIVAAYAQPSKTMSATEFGNTIPSEEVLKIWHSADAVCFDVDSTVCIDEGIDELADFCGAGKAVAEWTAKAMDGSVPFEQALAARLSLFNPSLAQVHEFLEKRPPRISPGITGLIKKLMAKKIDVYLVSGGFRQMINPVALQLGIPLENIFANQLVFGSSGEFIGFDSKEPTSRSGGKAIAVQQIRKVHDYKAMVMIGDGATDLEARKLGGADLFICYAGVQLREAVAEKADWLVFNFEELLTSLS